MHNAANWIEEEAVKGNDVDFSILLTNQAFKCVAIHVPTTVNDLKSMQQFDEGMLRVYGERIVRCVQLYLERHSLKELLYRDETDFREENYQKPDLPKLKRQVLPCLLSKDVITEIELLLIEMATKWAKKEKRLQKRKNFELDYLSVTALKSIAFHAPTSIEDLQAIGSLEESMVWEYGERIVLAVQMVLTKNSMQQNLGMNMNGLSENYGAPLTPVSSVESGATLPSTPSSSFSDLTGTAEERLHEASQELVEVLKILATNWAEEERIISGNSMYCWDILSDESIKRIASQCPRTTTQLQSIWSVDTQLFNEYGPRIVAIVQSILERYDLETFEEEWAHSNKVDVDELEMSHNSSLMREKAAKGSHILPENLARELFSVLKTLRKSWADEERVFLERPVHDRDVISREALASISQRAPTTVEHLKKIKNVKEDTIKEYGVRIIAVVQMFLEMKKIHGSKQLEESAPWERQEILVSSANVMPY
ncbi:hypothetical protein ACA910_000992 [Epithemia clementina (nom. ined.)]